jgi:hypothetical protein
MLNTNSAFTSSSSTCCQSLLSTRRVPSSKRSRRIASVSGLISPHPGANIPLIVTPPLAHVALYAICFRFYRCLSPTTVTRRQRPFPPRAHAISPSYLTVSIVVTRSHSNNTYVEDVMPWLVCPTRCATWGYKRAIEGIRQDRCFG